MESVILIFPLRVLAAHTADRIGMISLRAGFAVR